MAGRLLTDFAALPALMRVGLLLFALGAGFDVLYHAAPAADAALLETFLGNGGYWAHLLTLAGMLISVIGLFKVESTPELP
jgi:hypothetical protein